MDVIKVLDRNSLMSAPTIQHLQTFFTQNQENFEHMAPHSFFSNLQQSYHWVQANHDQLISAHSHGTVPADSHVTAQHVIDLPAFFDCTPNLSFYVPVPDQSHLLSLAAASNVTMSDNFLLNYDDIVQVATYPSIRVDKYNEFSYHNCNLATEARIIQTVTDITQDIVRDVRAASQLNPTKSAFHAAQLQMMSKRLSSRHITATHVIITGISAVLLTPAAKENLYHTLDKIFDQLELGETYLIADQIRSCNPMTDGSVSPNGSQPPTQSLIFKLSTPIYTDCPYRVTRIMREPLHIKTSTGNITELYSRMSTTSAPTDHTVSSASKQPVEFVHTANLCTRKQSDGVSTGSVIAAYRSPSINTATIDTIGHTIAAHAASCTNHPHTIIVLPGVSSLQLNNEHFPRYAPELFVLVFSHTTDVSVNNSIQKAMSVPMSPSEWNKERKFLYGNWIHLDARPSVENFHLAPLSDNARLQKFELLLVTLPSPNIPISTLLAAVPVIQTRSDTKLHTNHQVGSSKYHPPSDPNPNDSYNLQIYPSHRDRLEASRLPQHWQRTSEASFNNSPSS